MAEMQLSPEKQMEMYVKQESVAIAETVESSRIIAKKADLGNKKAGFSEFMAQYNRITDMCFNDCASDFTTRNVLAAENTCSMNCVEKYLKATQRMSERFSEHNLMSSDNPAANMQGMKK